MGRQSHLPGHWRYLDHPPPLLGGGLLAGILALLRTPAAGRRCRAGGNAGRPRILRGPFSTDEIPEGPFICAPRPVRHSAIDQETQGLGRKAVGRLLTLALDLCLTTTAESPVLHPQQVFNGLL